jgi:hypothetical protein
MMRKIIIIKKIIKTLLRKGKKKKEKKKKGKKRKGKKRKRKRKRKMRMRKRKRKRIIRRKHEKLWHGQKRKKM